MPTAPDGLVLVDKDQGWTSHDVVARMRRIAGTRKVGHAGTLDPMATGLLLVGLGKATRLLGHLARTDKAYVATARLGVTTVTDDAEGEVVASADASGVSDDSIATALGDLTGDIEQVPSSVSAIKVDGKRSYARVRSGDEVQLAARPVCVSVLEVTAVRRESTYVDVDLHVECSTGTYVRAIARDLGAALGVGGHLTALRRTRVGPYDVAHARTLEALGGHLVVLGLSEVARASFAVRELSAEDARIVAHGGWLPADVVAGDDSQVPVAAIGPDGELVALLDVATRAGRAKPVAVFAPA